MATRQDFSDKKKYLIKVQSGNEILTYTATNLIFNKNFLSFIDKYGNKLMINISNIISIEELKVDGTVKNENTK